MVVGGARRLTEIIVGISVCAWVLAAISGSSEWATIQGGFIPIRFSGATTGFVIPAFLTPVTATLVHGGLFHLLLNMVMLWFCGRAVEPIVGPVRLGVLYVIGAYAAALGQYLAGPSSPDPMIGASGAISAVIALYALLFSRNEVRPLGPIPAHWVRMVWLAAAWIGIQWLISFSTGQDGYAVATAAHVGGFLAGLALARPILASRYNSRGRQPV